MKEPVLVILAAGMGSRFGGLKQLAPIDEQGHNIIDFSIYDAKRAGFKKVVFIIKKEIEADFKAGIGNRVANSIEVEYVYQELDKLPTGYSIPDERVKPWGTGHAILCCKEVVDAPFVVINADDFYGADAYKVMYDYLKADRPESDFFMVGYVLENTLTDNGHVSRGVCTTSNGLLETITERIRIEKQDDHGAYTEDDGATWTALPKGSIVSMNMFGFSTMLFKVLEEKFDAFYNKCIKENPLKGEYLIPSIVDEMLKDGSCKVNMLQSNDKWYGVTYKEDKPMVEKAIKQFKDDGLYPNELWK